MISASFRLNHDADMSRPKSPEGCRFAGWLERGDALASVAGCIGISEVDGGVSGSIAPARLQFGKLYGLMA